MANVLVTGATGFIGTHLVATLAARGDTVTCLVRKSSRIGGLRQAGAELAYGDVTSRDGVNSAVAGRDIVYHLAGCTMALQPRYFYLVNQHGVANVARACAGQTTPPVLVVVSSLAAAGPAMDGRPKTEADRPSPVSHYGHSKRAGERAAEAFADRVPITVVRPPIVLGQGDRMGLPLFRSIARLGVHLAPGLQRRFSVIHADDLVQLLILAAERGKRLPARSESQSYRPDGYYFAASEEAPTYADLGRLVGEALGRHLVVIVPTATPLVWMVAWAGEAISHLRHDPLFMNLDKAREINAGSWICSAEAAAQQLDFSVGAPLLERLRQTAEWYRQAGWL
ncbi:MAG: NAD-dependent epimerase/dehydratase family protein [Planctomycetaceae bacterium]|nr:NAD-dependent epimerase/dehydratase family protein [Planctomycetaceae bacterium]